MSTHLDVDRRFTVCPLLGSGARCGRVSVSRATAGPTSVTPTRRQVVDGGFFLLLVSCVVFISLAGFGLIFLFFSCSGASEVALYIARLIGLRFFFFLFSRLLLFEMQSMHLDHTLSLQPSSVHSDSPTRYPRRLLMVRWSHLKVANFQIEPPSLSRDLTSPFY